MRTLRTTWPRDSPELSRHQRAVLWLLWGIALIGAWGLLMDIVTMLALQPPDSWITFCRRVIAAGLAFLFAAAARSGRAAATGHGPPSPRPAPPVVQGAAVIGTLALVPYVVMKQIWAWGGTFAGIAGGEMRAASERNGASDLWLALESWGLDFTVLFAVVGIVLIWSLVRPWGHALPRWFLLAPALLGAASLLPYGAIGTCYLILATAGGVTLDPGDFDTAEQALQVGWVGLSAFAGYGTCLTVAACSYWRRTARPDAAPPASTNPDS